MTSSERCTCLARPFLATLLLTTATLTGCASVRPYLTNRLNDAGDIFTAAAGLGAGARARIGPLHAGLMYNLGDVGWRAGQLVDASGRCNPTEAEFIGFSYEFFAPRDLSYAYDDASRYARKGYHAESQLIPFVTTDFASGKPGTVPAFPHPYWTQLEIQAGLLGSLRLGFNVGELLDFILGWTTLDIFGDDVPPTGGSPGSPQ